MIINLRDFYPYYTCDDLIDVPDEIGAVLLESKREKKNYWNQLGYHKVYYSLDRGDGIEYETVEKPITPEEAYLHKAITARYVDVRLERKKEILVPYRQSKQARQNTPKQEKQTPKRKAPEMTI